MKRILGRIGKWLGVALVVSIAALVVTVLVRQGRTFDAPYPAIHASDDPKVIARGRYLAYGPAHCVDCHGAPDTKPGAPEVVLSGGMAWHLPIGTIWARNLTSDVETGIGGARDEELARVLRHGVARDGRAMIPFMPFANLSDDDLTAVLSFLRTLPPVRNAVPEPRLNPLGRALRALVLEPKGPTRAVPRTVEAAPTAEYGRYLVEDVGNCVGCHTRRDLGTGAPIGPLLGGGLEIGSHVDERAKFVTPNLTPHPTDGWIASWDEQTFVARFRLGGPTHPATPMPWRSYARMTEDDLRAIFRYLKTVPPAPGGPKPGSPALVSANGVSPRG
jgi:mono/diheme cytochrome c family protein